MSERLLNRAINEGFLTIVYKWTSSPQLKQHHPSRYNVEYPFPRSLLLQYIHSKFCTPICLAPPSTMHASVDNSFYDRMYHSLQCRTNSRNSIFLNSKFSLLESIPPLLHKSDNSSVPLCHTRSSVHFRRSTWLGFHSFVSTITYSSCGRIMGVWLSNSSFSIEVHPWHRVLWLERSQM